MSAVHLTKADFLTRVANYEANPNLSLIHI